MNLKRAGRALLGAALLVSLPSSVVLGHAELETAEPAPDARVPAPSELVATFSQDLDPTRTSLEVRDADGERVAAGGQPGDSPREFSLDLPGLPPGEYEVRWTSFASEDGELARGDYTFTVLTPRTPSPSPVGTPTGLTPSQPTTTAAPTATGTPTATLRPAPVDSGADVSAVLVPIVVALAVVAVLATAIVRRRST